MSLPKHFFFLLFLCVCLSFQLYVQINGLVFHDLLWSFEIAKRLIAGKSYLHDYFETNPPLLYYLHALLTLSANKLHQPIIVVFCSFISLCLLGSLWLSNQLLKVMFVNAPHLRLFIIVSQAFLVTVLLNVDYGQKEMIMVLLSFPYFWCAALLMKGLRPSRKMSLLIGVLAGLGFAFKPPYFYCAPALTELYLLFYLRQWRLLLRVECLLICAIFLLYLSIGYAFSPSYFNDVFPIILKSYANQSFISLSSLLRKDHMIFFASLCLLVPWVRRLKPKKHSSLTPQIDLWFIVSIGFALCFVVQHKGWHYQSLPLFASSVICASLCFWQTYQRFQEDSVAKILTAYIALTLTCCFGLYPVWLTVEMKMQCHWHGRCDFVKSIDEISKLSPKKDFYMFSTQMESSYFIYYGGLKLNSRFAALWPLPAAFNRHNPNQAMINKQLQAYIVEDFQRFKPSMVLVGEHNTSYVNHKQFNYLDYMQTNAKFKELWKQYYHKENLFLMADQAIKLEVYLRQPGSGQS